MGENLHYLIWWFILRVNDLFNSKLLQLTHSELGRPLDDFLQIGQHHILTRLGTVPCIIRLHISTL